MRMETRTRSGVSVWPKGLTTRALVTMIFGFIGAVFMVVGIVLLADETSFRQYAVEIPAAITEIEQYYDTDSDGEQTTRHRVYVQYEMHGETYESELGQYVSTWRVGDVITVFCDPENPWDVRGGGGLVLCVVFVSLGSVFVAVTVVLLVRGARRGRRNRRLLTEGRMESVPITEIRQVDNVRINNRHPFRIVCLWQSPFGEQVAFQSDYLLGDPSDILAEAGVTEMTVYIDEQDPKRYTMDHSPLRELGIRVV